MFVVASKTSSSCLYYVVCACVDLIFPLMMMNIELPLVEMSTYVSNYCHKVGSEISRSVIDVE